VTWSADEVRDQVSRQLRCWGQSARPGVVAVSGGADSVALLCLLVELRQQQEVGPLCVAHVNHQLRGVASDADEVFVHKLQQQLSAQTPGGLGWRCLRVDVVGEARRRRAGLEATARQLRYAALAQVAAEWGASWVATGHTADDQAETVLHRLLRGTGLRGLAGIRPRRSLATGIELLRPLLAVPRQALRDYLQARGQDWREDASNQDRRLTRNRLRQELLPLLVAQYNPALVPILCRLAAQAAEAQSLVEQLAQDLLRRAELPRAGEMIVLDARRLEESSTYLICEVFRCLWRREGWPSGALTFDDWQRAAAVARGQLPAVDLAAGVRLRRCGVVVQVQRRPEGASL
jgi:tRNA(Ile)-lysidine synthase